MNLDLEAESIRAAIPKLPRPWMQALATGRLNGLTGNPLYRHARASASIVTKFRDSLPAFDVLLLRIDALHKATADLAALQAAHKQPATAADPQKPPQPTAQK